ncbi:hypothetical protein A2368_02770 [Candidatus Collierbacteria bacterium RIFOXYB1_FULL_49_13]|uniref:Uncharacterized protein n=1 Tax=Candidatus Collierbacteria bacterium RIFOXYB1_FULL_49_13 TaxID=1817728 RepID=A0A1F5FEW7_9BACT|nr:MAG: hypothetical protein A2368_02770 [Candidatus Collierbacteria bacterium RIFOXYB1_FULL_49_13]
MTKLTQLEIRKEREAIDGQIKGLEEQIEDLRTKRVRLQKKCNHPKSYQYSACGELGWKCPDCGWQT